MFSISVSSAGNSYLKLNKVHSNMNVFPVKSITTEMSHFLSRGNGKDDTDLDAKQLCSFPRVITGYPVFSLLACCYRMVCFTELFLRYTTSFSDHFKIFFSKVSNKL